MTEREESQDGAPQKPIVQFDLLKGTPLQFVEITEEFDRGCKAAGEPSPLTLSNGWCEITPERAEDFLRRNPKGANRKASLATVRYYNRQMKRGDWAQTGQPLIFTVEGVLIDGQHRLWAAYLGGATFTSYVIFDVPPNQFVFAYIDNCKPRTPATALQTAGFDGVSPVINGIIQVCANVDAGSYTMQRAARVDRLSPIEVLRVAQSDSKIKEAARFTAADFHSASALTGHKDVVGYVTYKIMGLADEFVAADFWNDVTAPEGELPEDNAAVALRKCLEADKRKPRPMQKHLVLAHCTLAFNKWRAGESVKRLKIPVTDDFPVFAEDAAEEPAEEAAAE